MRHNHRPNELPISGSIDDEDESKEMNYKPDDMLGPRDRASFNHLEKESTHDSRLAFHAFL